MRREEMTDWLLSLDYTDRFPLWVISHERAGTAPLLERAKKWETAEDVHVFVNEDQVLDYALEYPMFQIHTAPGVSNNGTAKRNNGTSTGNRDSDCSGWK